MTSPRVRRPWLRATAFGAAALAAIAAACEAPGPVQPSPVAVSMQGVRTDARTGVVAVSSSARISRGAIEAAVRQNYPEVFQAAAGESSTLMFVVAPDGRIERHERLRDKRTRAEAPTAGEARQMAQATGLRKRSEEPAVVDVVSFAPGQMGAGRVEVVWARTLSPDQVSTTAVTTRERVPQPAGPSQLRTPAAGEHPDMTLAQAREQIVRTMPQVARNGTDAEFVWIIASAGGQVLEYGDSNDAASLNRHVDDVLDVQVFKGEQLVFNNHPVGLVYVRLKG